MEESGGGESRLLCLIEEDAMNPTWCTAGVNVNVADVVFYFPPQCSATQLSSYCRSVNT